MSVKKIGEGEVALRWDACVGECPVWDERAKRLYWVDILRKRIHRFDPAAGTNDTFELPDIVPCIGLRAAGGLVLTLRKRFAFYDPGTGALEELSAVEEELPGNRFNDGKVDPRGRFWAGTMDAKEWKQPRGNLFRLGADRRPELVQPGVVCANGIGWSPDARTMYFTESFRYVVHAYDFEPETGAVSNRRTFLSVDKTGGAFPDGLCVDAEGFVWNNIVGPGRIERRDPSGKLERTLQLPVSRATSCTFGGDDLRTLYITSSTETLSPEQLRKEPLAGCLFAVPLDVKGLPAGRFSS